MIMVGISGKAHSGKDTVADILVEDYGFIKLTFADKLKKLVRHYYKIPDKELWTDRKTPEVRRILQGTGELLKGLEGEDFWIYELQKKLTYRSMQKGWNNRVVISDVRYENEKAFVEECSGITIRIDRPDREEIEFNPEHISEKGLENFEYIVVNDETLNHLKWKIKDIMANENISLCPGIRG